MISAIIVALSTSASSSYGILYPATAEPVASSSSNAATDNTSGNKTALQQQPLSVGPPLNAIFKKAENSTVQIVSKLSVYNNPGRPQPQSPITALGSGFVYDTQGHIVTNSHVVDGAQTADITFVDGNKYSAKVIGNDIYSDIAVLKIVLNNTQQSKQQQAALSMIKSLPIGNSSKVEVGDQVIAIGNPFGLSDTMTTGIVSGISRVLPAAAGVGFSIPDAIQTDAPINPGNSGGPLLNIKGEVIGMSTAILSGTGGFSGIGFAVPSNTITKIVPTLIQKGTYNHPFLGLTVATLTSDIAQNLTGLEAAAASNLKGIYVDTITKDGPADKAGIHGSTTDQYSKKHVGDIIVAVDGRPVARSDDMITYVDQHKSVGDNVILTVYRDGHTMDLKVTLAARPSVGPSLITILPPLPPSIPPPPTPPPRSPSPPSPPP